MPRWAWCVFVVLTTALLVSCGGPGDPRQVLSLADRVEFLEDRTGTLSLEEVTASHWNGAFRRPGGNLNSELVSSAFWIRMRMDSVEFARRDGRTVVSTGANLLHVDAYATTDREAPFRWTRLDPAEVPREGLAAPGYDLPPRDETAWIIFRVQSDRAFLFAPRVQTSPFYEDARRDYGLRVGTYYGLMIGAIAYNLFLALWMRDRAYLFYVLFETSFCATMADYDRTVALVWPSMLIAVPVGLNERLQALTGVLTVLFARQFLDLRAAPRLSSVSGVIGISGLLVIFYPTSLGREHFVAAANFFILCVAVHVSFMGVYSWRRGNANAPLFVLAWGILLPVVIIATLMNLGAMFPGIGYIDVIRFGSAVEAMLLAAALARRMSTMKRAEADTRAALAEARIGMSQMLERQLASLHALVGGVAHEIGNPLNFATGGAKDVLERLLQAEATSEELAERWNAGQAGQLRDLLGTARQSAALATRGTERIGGVVKNLRAYLGSGGEAMEVTNVHDCIRSTIALLETHLRAQSVAVKLDLRGDGAISARPGELNQVVMNLVLNACQAMPNGGQVEIVSEEDAGTLRIVVRDNGPGVPDGLRTAIFDPFFTTRAPSEGTGLGLSVSREIIRRHGGTLDLLPSAQYERGAAFAILLPRT